MGFENLFEHRLRARELFDLDQTSGQIQSVLRDLGLDRHGLFEKRQCRRWPLLTDVDLAKEGIRLRISLVQHQRPFAERHHVVGSPLVEQNVRHADQPLHALRIVFE